MLIIINSVIILISTRDILNLHFLFWLSSKVLSETHLTEMFKSNNTKLSSSDNFLLKRSFVNWWWLYHEMARCQLLRRQQWRRQWHGPMIIRERFYSNSSKGVISKNDSVFDVVICWFNKEHFFFLLLTYLVWTVFLCVSHWLSGLCIYSNLLNKLVVEINVLLLGKKNENE